MKNNQTIPESWELVPLRTLLDVFESGSRPKGGVKHIETGIPSLGGEHLHKNGGFTFDKIKYVPNEFASSMRRGHIQKGDILVVKDGATTGKTSLIRNSFPYKDAVVNEHLFICRCKENTLSKYVFYFLFSLDGNQQILQDFRGAAQGGISQRFADIVQVPLTLFDEQKLIVSEIEKQFSRLDEAMAALKRIKANLKRYKASVLNAAIEGKLTEEWRKEHPDVEPAKELLKRILVERRRKWEGNYPKKKYKNPKPPDTSELPDLPEGWIWTNIEQLAEAIPHAIKAGPFGSSLKKSFYVPKGYKIYGQEQVLKDDPYYGDYYIDEERFKTLSSCAVKPGDILISLVGTIGRVLILPNDIEPGIINPRLVKLTLDSRLIGARYFKTYLQSPYVRYLFTLVSHGGTMDILNLTILKEIPIPLPPIEEQIAIIDEIERVSSIEIGLETEIEKSVKRAERLRQSILKKAFLGKLVPIDIDDKSERDLNGRN